jgi:AcrR family transcriptional regulator
VQAELRHGQLLQRALDMFLDHGFEQTTIDAIAAAMKMTKRTIYARYEDKAALFRATVHHAIRQWIVPEQALRSLETDSLEETLRTVARMRIAHDSTPEGLKLQRIINAESYRFPDISTAAYEQGTMPLIEFLANLLRRHQVRGEVRAEHPLRVAHAFLTLVVGGPLRVIVAGHKIDPEELEDRITFTVGLFLNGIRTRPGL